MQPERIGRVLDLRSRVRDSSDALCCVLGIMLYPLLSTRPTSDPVIQALLCPRSNQGRRENVTTLLKKMLAVSLTISTFRCWSESELKVNNNLVRLEAKAQMRMRSPPEHSLLAYD